ncbi:MAG: CHAD domain-containing protein [Pseudomonas sp.]|nr:CHAD domain-containing protein [Pseudomonas sp.]MDZ4194612.1 CHAD domain-containing protein [Pseudomonas sp.]
MASVDKYVSEVLALEVALFHARARLEAGSDSEALHDLRIAVRKIRSLLIPLRVFSELESLRQAAAQVGRVTTPTRDLEVMIAELETHELSAPAASRRARLNAGYRQIIAAPELDALFLELDLWPAKFRAAASGHNTKAISQIVTKALAKQVDKLRKALHDAQYDRHELRILVKRTRYLTEAFPQLSPLSPKAAKSLKSVQSALGSWHDHFQWCLQATIENDLQPLAPLWAKSSVGELELAEREIQTLKRLL